MSKGLYKGGGDGLSLARETEIERSRGGAAFLAECMVADDPGSKEEEGGVEEEERAVAQRWKRQCARLLVRN